MEEAQEKIDTVVDSSDLLPVQGTSDSRYIGNMSGLSFARLGFSWIKSSIATSSDSRNLVQLETRRAKQPTFPDRNTGLSLVNRIQIQCILFFIEQSSWTYLTKRTQLRPARSTIIHAQYHFHYQRRHLFNRGLLL